ncbi:hypothetical protein EDD86DRAFT_287 [Gorgonomyces haynaldii]|nr:hypothetical protein EDD86DRAFT_287 [Gorgonomyces haynaldii]
MILAVASALLVNAAIVQHPKSEQNVLCIATQCLGQVLACQGDSSCKSTLSCIQACKTEACTIQCNLLPPPNEKLSKLVNCFFEKGCISAPKNPPQCPRPKEYIRNPGLDLITGDWFVSRGLSPVYDQFQCQKMNIHAVNSTFSQYDYYLAAAPGQERFIPCQVQTKPGIDYLVTSYTIGDFLQGTDEWYLLDRTDDFLLIYYCGSAKGTAPYQGGIIMSKSQSSDIPKDVLDRFEIAINKTQTGVVLSDFVINDNLNQCS